MRALAQGYLNFSHAITYIWMNNTCTHVQSVYTHSIHMNFSIVIFGCEMG